MNRSTILLITLLLGLGAIVYFMLPGDKEVETSYKPSNVNVSVDSASAVKLEIQRTGKSVTLENVGGKWMITAPLKYAADATEVKQVIGSLSKFKVGSLISSNPEKQHVFEVDTAGTTLTVTDRSGKSTSLVLGKMGPSFSEVYFRIPASQDVYLGKGLDSWTVNKEVKDWRDKTILAAPSESITGLTYSVGKKEEEFHRDSTGWKSESRTLDAAAMTPTLNSFANLRADDFIDSLIALPPNPATISVHAAENTVLTIVPAQPDSQKYYVRTSATPQIFTISKYIAQQLLKPVAPEAVPKPVKAIPVKKSETPPPVVTKEEMPPPPPVVAEKEPKKAESTAVAAKKPKKRAADSAFVLPPVKSKAPPIEPTKEPVQAKEQSKEATPSTSDDEGELTVYTAKSGETMTAIAKKFNVTVEQILKWNLLKTTAVKPGKELYIYVRK